jgi:hypothetical protein
VNLDDILPDRDFVSVGINIRNPKRTFDSIGSLKDNYRLLECS